MSQEENNFQRWWGLQNPARGRSVWPGVLTGDTEMLFLGWALFYVTCRQKSSDPFVFPSVACFTSDITFLKLGTEEWSYAIGSNTLRFWNGTWEIFSVKSPAAGSLPQQDNKTPGSPTSWSPWISHCLPTKFPAKSHGPSLLRSAVQGSLSFSVWRFPVSCFPTPVHPQWKAASHCIIELSGWEATVQTFSYIFHGQ